MKAAILTVASEPLTLEDVTPLALGPRDVRVAMEASGVCHTDLSIACGNVPTAVPSILGHEGAGRVVEAGASVTRVATGDRVIASIVPSCGDCYFCLLGESHLCTQASARMQMPKGTLADGSTVVSLSGLGTFAEEMTVHESMLVKVDTDLPSDQLALIGCGITTGVGAALNTAQVQPGSTVAVIGCGGVGQSVIQGARIAGASRIFAIDPVEFKRKTAEQLGATDLVDPAITSPVEQVRAATGGVGVDYAFEVIGLPEAVQQAFQIARRGGSVVVVGMPRWDAQVTFPGMSLFLDNKSVLGCFYGSAQVRRDFPRLIRLVEAGRLDIGSMISRRLKLDEVNEAMRAMEAGEVIRSVLC